MKIEDLVQLLNNRLREFKLSGDYARMNGDLERMNAADKEVLSLEDTLFKLNLLVDTSKSAAVKDAILAEVMTDGSVAILGEYDITPYATDLLHEEKIMNILSKMGVMDTAEKIDDYIQGKYLSSPVTGEMVMSAALAYDVDTRLMMAIMEQDSSFGTAGKAVRTLNPGNVGNDDSGNTRTYESWQEGVTAVAEWLSRHRGSTIIPEIPEEIVVEPMATTPATASSSEETLPVTTSTTTTTTASSSFSPTTASTSFSPTPTPIVTASPSYSPTPTPTPEVTTSTTTTTTASSSFLPTPIPTSTMTPIVTASPSPTASPSYSPTPTPTPEVITSTTTTTTASSTPTPEPSASPTPEPEATTSPEETPAN